MTNYTFEEIKGLLLKSIQEHDFESELRLCFHDNPNEYMIIIYDDHCSFQRCGNQKEACIYVCRRYSFRQHLF